MIIRAYPALYRGETPSQETGTSPLAVYSSRTVYVCTVKMVDNNELKRALIDFMPLLNVHAGGSFEPALWFPGPTILEFE